MSLFGALAGSRSGRRLSARASPPFTLSLRARRLAASAARSGRRDAVPLTVTNIGQAGVGSGAGAFLVSLALAAFARARTPFPHPPYHDGIRRSLVRVSRRARASRLPRECSPGYSGLYGFMGHGRGGRTWFAQVSPRQPRYLVVVLPTLAGLFAPLPLLVALAGILAIRRFTAPDVVWCAATRFPSSCASRKAVLEPTRVAYWLAVVAAVLLPCC